MRSALGVVLAVLPACAGVSSPGSARPMVAAGSSVDPTAGDIRVTPWGWTLDNISSGATNISPLDREEIRRTLREELGAILLCYQRARRDRPDLEGVVRAVFTIELDGRTRKVDTHGVDPMFAACLRNLIATALFPSPTSVPLRVELSLAFSPPLDSEPLAEVEAGW
jgi:hypothetical protein